MLNVFKNKQKNPNTSYFSKNKTVENTTKSELDQLKNIIYYPSSTKEWIGSIYSYNKSYIKQLIVFDTRLNKLLGSYCNMLQDKIKIAFKLQINEQTERTNQIFEIYFKQYVNY